ncbi:lipase family protein [Gordonia sp. (in: high G+C Gram-positive bacteria)]|uniref:lipase family protein n=1 Tax=Gordonia sp. (in: high G+C Gram-positive bacteria) TaxID=84139 RepID=UPI003F9957DD
MSKRQRPLIPADDPFYALPADFEHDVPGAIIRTRPVEIGFLGVVPQLVDATQMLYHSTTMNGEPTVAVTTVVRGKGRAVPTRVLSYQCAIDAIDSTQFPSYEFQRGSRFVVSVPRLEYLLVAAAVRRGWTVSIPDHEGLHGNWGVAREPGYHILDGVRAILNDESATDSAIPVGLWGYSGGGLASSWAAEMAAEYAPELNVIGAVLGSPVGDPGETLRRLNGTVFAGLPVLMIAALARNYPEVCALVDVHGTDRGKQELERAAGMSTMQAIGEFARHEISEFTDLTMPEILADPGLQTVLDDIRLGGRAPAMPVLVTQSVNDPVISVDDVAAQVDRYRGEGADVTFLRDRLSEHILLHPLAAPHSIAWLDDRCEAGLPGTAEPGETTTVWSIALSRVWLVNVVELLLVVVLVVCGRDLRRSERTQ